MDTLRLTPRDCNVVSFKKRTPSGEPVLEPGRYYGHGALTVDKKHCYCSWCDIFWPVGFDCFHFDEDKRPVRS